MVSLVFPAALALLAAVPTVSTVSAPGTAPAVPPAVVDDAVADRPSPQAVVIPIHGAIDPFLAVLLRRGVEEARQRNAQFVILDIDTFGGRVDTALEIANTLSRIESMTTVAYVGNRPEGTGVSWSAGALIALACNEIYMAPGTSMGAAAPVIQGVQGQEAADEKTVSAVRGQMAALAERNGHPTSVARAMVDAQVVLTAAVVNGEDRLVTGSELDVLRRRAEDGEVTLVEGEVVSDAGKLLTLTAGEMERFGVSAGTVASIDELAAGFGVRPDALVRVRRTPADRTVAALTGSGFTTLLILAGLVALFLEFSSPGFGVPGAVALVCFGTLFAANLMMGRVGSLEIILFVLGLALLIFEVFVIPGFGVAGISGLVAIGFSLILALQTFVIPEYDYQWEIAGRNLMVVGGGTIGAVITALLAAMLVKDTRLFQRLTLADAEGAEEGYTAQETSMGARLLGKEGVARTDLRPAGNVLIDNEVVSAESDGGYIPRDSAVVVVRVDGNRVVVRSV